MADNIKFTQDEINIISDDLDELVKDFNNDKNINNLSLGKLKEIVVYLLKERGYTKDKTYST